MTEHFTPLSIEQSYNNQISYLNKGLERLTTEYQNWCVMNFLPDTYSADELINHRSINEPQTAYLLEFIERWNKVQDLAERLTHSRKDSLQFKKWKASRYVRNGVYFPTPSLAEFTYEEDLENTAGYVFDGGSFIYTYIDASDGKVRYGVMIENTDQSFTDLEEATRHLWNNWAVYFYEEGE